MLRCYQIAHPQYRISWHRNLTGEDHLSPEQDSQAYIVRIWRSGPDGRWCFSIQDVATNTRHGFANLESFLAYFYTTVRDPPDAQDKATGDAGPAGAAPPG